MASDYSDIGLNEYLQAASSPIVPQVFHDAYSFNASLDRGSITNRNLKDFSFSKGAGGTIALGGTSNGNGLLTVQNAAGTEIVRLDNTGMTINAGSLTIKDSAGTTIMDATGLVSAANFSYAGTTSNSNRLITSATPVGFNSGTVITTNFPRQTNILVMYTVTAHILWGGATDTVQFGNSILAINGTTQSNTTFEQGFGDTRLYTPGAGLANYSTDHEMSAVSVVTMAAGIGTLALQANVDGQTLVVTRSSLFYLALGK